MVHTSIHARLHIRASPSMHMHCNACVTHTHTYICDDATYILSSIHTYATMRLITARCSTHIHILRTHIHMLRTHIHMLRTHMHMLHTHMLHAPHSHAHAPFTYYTHAHAPFTLTPPYHAIPCHAVPAMPGLYSVSLRPTDAFGSTNPTSPSGGSSHGGVSDHAVTLPHRSDEASYMDFGTCS